MSGVNRNIKAEIMADGITSIKEVQAKFSPKAILSEKGRSIYTPAAKSSDKGDYLGRNAKPRKAK